MLRKILITKTSILRLTRSFSAFSDFNKYYSNEIAEMKIQGLYKKERFIITPQSSSIKTTNNPDKTVINMCANNYLGLAHDASLEKAAIETIKTHGYGLSSVRFICGTQNIHKKLEKKIAEFHGTEDSILYPSCFDANTAFFEALLNDQDAIISDELNHASIIDGMRMAKQVKKTKVAVYKHLDLNDLERKLTKHQNARYKIVATDGVFSMDGDIAPLREICDLADKYNAFVFIDECHATGFVGTHGRGTPEHCNTEGRISVINSTLGKALGGATGGYTASSSIVCDMLRQRARPYLFSNSVTPSVVGATLKCLEMLTSSTELQEKVRKNTKHFREGMKKSGFEVIGSIEHPIAPVMLYDAPLALEFADKMLDEGVYVIGFCYPVVPKGKARIRTQISASHSTEQIDFVIEKFIKVGKCLGII